jgi:hypothetical protein
MGTDGQIHVFIESGRRRVFASALEWPGWARSGKTEDVAVQALADYLPRYLHVVRLAGVALPAGDLAVTERNAGLARNADFGSLGEIAGTERKPLTKEAGYRLALLLEASWQAFERGARTAPAQLRKGPRGGGRDTEQIVRHVQDAEVMYARKMGLAREKAAAASQDAVACLRQRITAAVRAPATLQMPPNGWPARYAVRRMAWHVLDHLWEIEDKSDPA